MTKPGLHIPWQVTYISPMTVMDLLSALGGTLGLLLGGSIFSILETVFIFAVLTFSVTSKVLKLV